MQDAMSICPKAHNTREGLLSNAKAVVGALLASTKPGNSSERQGKPATSWADGAHKTLQSSSMILTHLQIQDEGRYQQVRERVDTWTLH
jgi:hypothetical protein